MNGYEYTYDIRINGRTYMRGFAENVDELIYEIKSAARNLDNDGSVKFYDTPTNNALDAIADVMRAEQ
jgi:hypothetical protein